MITPHVIRLKIPKLAALVLATLGSLAGCALYRLEKDLPAPYAAFLGEVRYLITSPERKAFLSSPDSGKDKLIEEFWQRRDPDPFTSENELRTEYYARISQADDLFKSDSPRGWLSDRGRIYILYGPPTERRTMTMTQEATAANRVEMWYYGAYTILFRDTSGTGSFRLETLDLSAIEDLNLARTGAPSRLGSRQGPGRAAGFSASAQPLLDFTVELRDKVRSQDRIEALLHLEIPLPLIWFKSDGGRFHTAFDVVIRVRDSKKAVVWEKNAGAEAGYAERDIAAKSGARHVIELPILIEGAEILARLADAPGTVVVRLTNRTGSETVEKTIDLK